MDKGITLILNLVGNACNMNCSYCYEHDTIKYDTINNLNIAEINDVKEFLSSFIDYHHIHILFHGGEPLLYGKDLIKDILKFIKTNFLNKYTIQIQTNGLLIDDDFINIFLDYNVQLSISLDPIGDMDLRKANNFEYRKVVISNISKYIKKIDTIGIVSVAHKYNINYFKEFIDELINYKIKFLTINKIRYSTHNTDYYITEKEYNKMLKDILIYWINNKKYKSIDIQPFISLLTGSKICIYSSDNNKCKYFKTFYNKEYNTEYCSHIISNKMPNVDKKCLECYIYDWCGGGCLVDQKDETFCESRKDFKLFLDKIKL